jgi:hypothetical protein
VLPYEASRWSSDGIVESFNWNFPSLVSDPEKISLYACMVRSEIQSKILLAIAVAIIV